MHVLVEEREEFLWIEIRGSVCCFCSRRMIGFGPRARFKWYVRMPRGI